MGGAQLTDRGAGALWLGAWVIMRLSRLPVGREVEVAEEKGPQRAVQHLKPQTAPSGVQELLKSGMCAGVDGSPSGLGLPSPSLPLLLQRLQEAPWGPGGWHHLGVPLRASLRTYVLAFTIPRGNACQLVLK